MIGRLVVVGPHFGSVKVPRNRWLRTGSFLLTSGFGCVGWQTVPSWPWAIVPAYRARNNYQKLLRLQRNKVLLWQGFWTKNPCLKLNTVLNIQPILVQAHQEKDEAPQFRKRREKLWGPRRFPVLQAQWLARKHTSPWQASDPHFAGKAKRLGHLR